MRLLLILTICLSSIPAAAQISTGPGPIEPRMTAADVVCVALVTPEKEARATQVTNDRIGRYRLHEVRIYKGGEAVNPSQVEVVGNRVSLTAGTRYLLFLDRVQTAKTLQAVEAVPLPRDFSPPSHPSEAFSLEDDLAEALANQPQNKKPFLQLLDQFAELSPKTVGILRPLIHSGDSQLSLAIMVILLRKNVDSRELFPQLVAELLETPGGSGLDLQDIVNVFLTDAAPSNEPALEQLAEAHQGEVSQAAIYALRKLGDPAATAFFVHELDATDPMIQYTAVISLAEIYKKSGDFGPGVGAFEQNPSRYVRIWKDWYNSNESQPTRP